VIEWLADNAWWLTAAGILMSVGGLGALFIVAVAMPADHFMPRLRGAEERRRHPVVRLLLRVARNIIGAILLVLGLVMAIPMVPGPGVLFILLGVSLMDIPGKHAMVRYIVSRPLVLQPLNALRAKWNRPPVQIPPDHKADGGQP
jgi:uncharacterized membrane protein HdeD (DUF308 family)